MKNYCATCKDPLSVRHRQPGIRVHSGKCVPQLSACTYSWRCSIAELWRKEEFTRVKRTHTHTFPSRGYRKIENRPLLASDKCE